VEQPLPPQFSLLPRLLIGLMAILLARYFAYSFQTPTLSYFLILYFIFAMQMNLKSQFGAFLDPVADKVPTYSYCILQYNTTLSHFVNY